MKVFKLINASFRSLLVFACCFQMSFVGAKVIHPSKMNKEPIPSEIKFKSKKRGNSHSYEDLRLKGKKVKGKNKEVRNVKPVNSKVVYEPAAKKPKNTFGAADNSNNDKIKAAKIEKKKLGERSTRSTKKFLKKLRPLKKSGKTKETKRSKRNNKQKQREQILKRYKVGKKRGKLKSGNKKVKEKALRGKKRRKSVTAKSKEATKVQEEKDKTKKPDWRVGSFATKIIKRDQSKIQAEKNLTANDSKESTAQTKETYVESIDANGANYPWLGSIIDSSSSDLLSAAICPAVLIHSQMAITAASCVAGLDSLDIELQLGTDYLGTSKWEYSLSRYTVSEILMDPFWDETRNENNMAIIVLNTPAADQFKPIKMVENNALINSNTVAKMLGWRMVYYDGADWSRRLQEEQVPVKSLAEGNNYFAWDNLLSESEIPVGHRYGSYTKACYANDGSPLVVQVGNEWRLAGIGSFQSFKDCDESRSYSVFTRLNSHLNWIYQQTHTGAYNWIFAELLDANVQNPVVKLWEDFDGDKNPNFLEYATGNPVLEFDPTSFIVDVDRTSNEIEGYTYVSYVTQDLGDVDYFPEFSTDLNNWLSFLEDELLSEEANLDGTTTITYQFNEGEATAAGKLFYRLGARPSKRYTHFERDVKFGQTVYSNLRDQDKGSSYPYKDYALRFVPFGESITIELDSSDFDTYLEVRAYNRNTGAFIETVGTDDDSGDGLNARFSFRVPNNLNREYVVRVRGRFTNSTGDYVFRSFYRNSTEPLALNEGIEDANLDSYDSLWPEEEFLTYYMDEYILENLVNDDPVTVSVEAGYSFDPVIQIVDAYTNQVYFENLNRNDESFTSVTFIPQFGIDYVVRVTSDSSYATGTYDIFVDPANLIELETTISATLTDDDEPNDHRSDYSKDDYYLEGVFSGDRVILDLQSTSFDEYLQLIDADTNELLAYSDDGLIDFIVEPNARYIVRVTTYFSWDLGSYTLSADLYEPLPEVVYLIAPGDEPYDGSLDLEEDGEYENPTRTGRLKDDYYVEDILVGETLVIKLWSDFDGYLQLIDEDTGTVIDYEDSKVSYGTEEMAYHVDSYTGNLIIRVTSYSSNTQGEYTLTLDTSVVGLVVPGNEYLDQYLDDFFENDKRSGAYANDYILSGAFDYELVRVEMWRPDGTTSIDPYLQLIDADTGDLIDYNDDGAEGANARIDFTVSPGRTYIIRATTYSSSQTGTYDLYLD